MIEHRKGLITQQKIKCSYARLNCTVYLVNEVDCESGFSYFDICVYSCLPYALILKPDLL